MCPEFCDTSLDVRVRGIPVHFSGNGQNKGCQHSLLQVAFIFYTPVEFLCYNLVEGIPFEAIFANIKVIWDCLFN